MKSVLAQRKDMLDGGMLEVGGRCYGTVQNISGKDYIDMDCSDMN